MDGKERIFLSIKEAISAVSLDFYQYPPQTRLFMDLCPLILGPGKNVINDSRYNGLWISETGRSHSSRMRKITPQKLGLMLIDALASSPPDAHAMAEICKKTFRVHAEPASKGHREKSGIWIQTDMESFKCKKCGRCCSELDYRHEISEQDYMLWQKIERYDILERVATITRAGKTVSYAVWIEPGTRKFSSICPWLAPANPKEKSALTICLIHEAKPEICRQYPGTRKHAEMTGCTGFDP